MTSSRFLLAAILAGCTTRAPARPAAETAAGAPEAPGAADLASAEDFRRRLHVLECAVQARCGRIGASEQRACEIEKPNGYAEEVFSLVRKGHYTVDRSQAETCLASWTNLTCHADRTLMPPACRSEAVVATVRGAVPPGGPCTQWDECAHGYCHAQPGCSSTCTAYVPLGGACDNNHLCEPEAWCWENLCRSRAKLGEPCHDYNQDCERGLWCKGYLPESSLPHGDYMREQPGTCAPRKGEGEHCVTYRHAHEDDEHCRPDRYCDWGAGDPTCRPRLPKGAECDWEDACADGLTCAGLVLRGLHPSGERYAVFARGTCVPWSDVGDPCDPSAYVTGCPSDMRCDEGTRTCRFTGRVGDPCEPGGEPAGTPNDRPVSVPFCFAQSYCDPATHTCARELDVGAPCSRLPSSLDPCLMSQCDAATSRCVRHCPKQVD
jgi:hypothetical protein